MSLIDYIFESTVADNTVDKKLIADGYKPLSSNRSLWRSITNELLWSKIDEDDIIKVEPDVQRAKSYSRAGRDEYVIWFMDVNGESTPFARSIGLTLVGDGDRLTVKKVSGKAIFAIVVNDYEKYSTTELRRERRKIAENRKHVKELYGVANEYAQRFESFKNSLGGSFDTNVDIVAKSDSVVERYMKLFAVMENSERFLKHFDDSVASNIEFTTDELTKLVDVAEKYRRDDSRALSAGNVDLSKTFTKHYNEFKARVDGIANVIDSIA